MFSADYGSKIYLQIATLRSLRTLASESLFSSGAVPTSKMPDPSEKKLPSVADVPKTPPESRATEVYSSEMIHRSREQEEEPNSNTRDVGTSAKYLVWK